MEKKINIAELLKDCPRGMELDCTMYEDCKFLDVETEGNRYLIRITTPCGIKYLDKYGCYTTSDKAKCVIFPKGKTTWDGFHRPFDDGDIVATEHGLFIGIVKVKNNMQVNAYCSINDSGCFGINSTYGFERLATEEEKQKLFDAIKSNGYKWNAETKTLEKLHKFKAGDEIRGKYTGNIYTISHITLTGYKLTDGTSFDFDDECSFELTLNKFDITTLVPFESRVLVRDHNSFEWEGEIFTRYTKSFNNSNFVTLGGESWKQCIPYNDNTKHLLGTTNNCDDFYKTWEQ